jgi:hypothetical protein
MQRYIGTKGKQKTKDFLFCVFMSLSIFFLFAFVTLCLCASVPLCLSSFVPFFVHRKRAIPAMVLLISRLEATTPWCMARRCSLSTLYSLLYP